MLRLMSIAAAAAVLAAPAFAADSIHVHTAGKSADEVRAEVHKAAVYLCDRQSQGSILAYYGQQTCVAKTERATLAQAGVGAEAVASR